MIEYKLTNESMDAIVKGLDLNKDDIVLAVGGSGDQAFAILEFAKEVRVVDESEGQLNYIEQRLRYLIEGRFKSFLEINGFGTCDTIFHGSKDSGGMVYYNWKKRDKYFSTPGRLENLREKASRFILLPKGDIEAPSVKEKDLTKIYFSNVRRMFPFYNDSHYRIRLIANNLPIDGLMYFAVSDNLRWSLEDADSRIPPELKLDKRLSALARRYQTRRKWNMWIPAVYGVVGHSI